MIRIGLVFDRSSGFDICKRVFFFYNSGSVSECQEELHLEGSKIYIYIR